jgi:hypothetical protein
MPTALNQPFADAENRSGLAFDCMFKDIEPFYVALGDLVFFALIA